jgi:NAD(P)H-hydrate repair Nnr-like enzyme with NAD(P)H-hydrate epimerase domain
LELADLVMQYPSGGASDSASNIENFRESLGTIAPGTVVNENLKPILFGEQGSSRVITISLEYRVAGSNAIFVKNQPYTVTINSTPINLAIDAPTTISPNQAITLNIKATLNSTTAVPTTLVKVDYPIGFQFVSATPAPSFGNNVWNLGNLAPGAEHDISISGTMTGVFSGDQKTFNVSSGSQSSTDKSAIDVVFNSVQQVIAIQKPFVEADIVINGISGSQFTATSKTPISAQIHYINNLDTTINNLQIQAKISGNAFDPKTVNTAQGFFNSATSTINWDKNYESQLAQVNPGDSGALSFSFTPVSLFSATSGLLSSPSINIEVDVSGATS